MKCQIQFDPSFVEEAVFLKVQSLEAPVGAQFIEPVVKNFHSEKNSIYENGKDEEAFKKFYNKFFHRLCLQESFENSASQFPLLDNSQILIFVKRAFSKKEEGSELYGEGPLKTAVLGIQVLRLQDRTWLEQFLRHEFLRVSDILDPAFNYSATVEIGGGSPTEDNRIRERFSRLWDDYIEERLSQPPGAVTPKTQSELLELARSGHRVFESQRVS